MLGYGKQEVIFLDEIYNMPCNVQPIFLNSQINQLVIFQFTKLVLLLKNFENISNGRPPSHFRSHIRPVVRHKSIN